MLAYNTSNLTLPAKYTYCNRQAKAQQIILVMVGLFWFWYDVSHIFICFWWTPCIKKPLHETSELCVRHVCMTLQSSAVLKWVCHPHIIKENNWDCKQCRNSHQSHPSTKWSDVTAVSNLKDRGALLESVATLWKVSLNWNNTLTKPTTFLSKEA